MSIIKQIQTVDSEEAKQQGRLNNIEKDRKQKDALALYVRGFSLQSISEFETINIGVQTLKKWEKQFNWKEQKELANISPNEIKAMIRSNIAAYKLGKQMPHSPDQIAKMASAWDKLDDNRKKAVNSMEAFDEFIDYFLDLIAKSSGKKREDNLQLLKKIRTLQDNYIQSLL